MPIAPYLQPALRRVRLLAIMMPLAALSLANCAAGGASENSTGLHELGQELSGLPRPKVLAAAGRLPTQLGAVFERVGGVSDFNSTGFIARYELKGVGAWATVFVYDDRQATVPDGLNSSLLSKIHADNMQVARAIATNGIAQEGILPFQDAPPQRCAVAHATQNGSVIANYGCATGVNGVVVHVQVTGGFPVGNKRDQESFDLLVRGFLLDVTRTVAGLPPLSAAMTPGAPTGAPQSAQPSRRLRL